MKVFYFSVNIEGSLKKEFYLIQHDDEFVDFSNLSQTQYVLHEEYCNEISILKSKKVINVEMDGYMYVILENALKTSYNCRAAFFECMKTVGKKNGFVILNINVFMPKQHIIDKRGNKLFEISCLERRELDHAMAWFSTLGGAFSALGDKIEYCAVMAGKISHQQFLLALRLGDPNLVSRCRLYLALSLIQQKQFLDAKNIIKSQYIIAKEECKRDKRLMSMCLGIWAKWKYDKKQARINGKVVK